uniref:Reverse transcriptase n=1 Tax=Leptobrachium leishanense TaxID=445787 RepID=A0A8C5MBU4_9ANUR
MLKIFPFSDISGYKVNYDKTRALPLGLSREEIAELRGLTDFQFSFDSLKYLGVFLTSDPGRLHGANYDTMFASLFKDLDRWNDFSISWVGRVACVKMNMLPRLYLFQALPTRVDVSSLAHLQQHIAKFVWQHKRQRVARRVLHRPRDRGGLGIPNLLYYYYAAQLTQFVMFHAPSGTHRWVDLESHLAAPDTPNLYFWLPKAHRPILRSTCSATINSLRIWDLLRIKHSLSSDESALSPIF